MFGRILVVVAGLLAAATPVKAEEMSPEEARRFVAGKLFAYSCFDGSNGAGRIFADGSVAGTMRAKADGPYRYAMLPAGTLRIKSNAVCASLKGLPFEPCFNLTRTDANTFRGSIRGMGFASCTFTRRSPRANFARATSSPMRLRASITGADGSN
jgi:hypothetical protein